MFSYIRHSNHSLVVLNLLLLLNVVVLPFAAVLLIVYVGTREQQTAVQIYSGVLFVGGIFYNLLWWYSAKNHRLLDRTLRPKIVRRLTLRYLFGPLLYGLAFVLTFFWYESIVGLFLCSLFALIHLLPTVADRVKVSKQGESGKTR